MGSYKTAAPCEVCGSRVAHQGKDAGFIVGYTIKGIQRLVHNRCRNGWRHQHQEIISGWAELRPTAFASLPPSIQNRIRRALKRNAIDTTKIVVLE